MSHCRDNSAPAESWCPGPDSNWHGLLHTPLKRARLPIPPPGQRERMITRARRVSSGGYFVAGGFAAGAGAGAEVAGAGAGALAAEAAVEGTAAAGWVPGIVAGPSGGLGAGTAFPRPTAGPFGRGCARGITDARTEHATH